MVIQTSENFHEEDSLAIFKFGLWRMGFLSAVKNVIVFSSN